MLAHRRAIRVYDKTKHIDTERVADCLRLAQLAPTSSNMQLWECYHITDTKTLEALHRACLQQTSVTTAQELVVFVVRPDYVKRRAKANLTFQERNIREHFPKEKQEKYLKREHVLQESDPVPLRTFLWTPRPAAQGIGANSKSLPPCTSTSK